MSESETTTAMPQVGAPPGTPEKVEIFDTTLRDGVQFEGISLTVDDKLRVAEQLDYLGVHWIEGGYPGANPKDEEFFRRAAKELDLDTSTLVAFGSTRRTLGKVDDDPTLRVLVESGVSTACIVGKSWDYHVTEALRTTLDEGVAMVGESVAFLKAAGLRVFFDAEHFFDGFKRNSEFALRVLEAAATNGADCLVLCDTNGGSLPHEVQRIVGETTSYFEGVPVGMHTQNDTGCAVANALAGVVAGATQVQGTINGYGERTGNCDLITFIPDLTLKMGIETLPPDRMDRLMSVSHHVAELCNIAPMPGQPYVGKSAFAHKAGLHTSALKRRPDAYEHVTPDEVGNRTRYLVSDLSGRATIELKAEEMGLELDAAGAATVVETLKRLEHEGFHFEAADASLELMIRQAAGWEQPFFEVDSFRVVVNHARGTGNRAWNSIDAELETDAIIRLRIGDESRKAVGEGNGPVDALYDAFRNAANGRLPALDRIHLVDYKVRIIDTGGGTGAVTRVLIDTTNGESTWTTIGVSENIIEASWHALADAVIYGLLHTGAAAG